VTEYTNDLPAWPGCIVSQPWYNGEAVYACIFEGTENCPGDPRCSLYRNRAMEELAEAASDAPDGLQRVI